ncbi:uncharacterized protein LOC142640268 [Castanea sativa]|uniref:uncharacterized protein LOC142640268 n=1 Tax=Castanea sativa TaxID=21020 RepID=UPI003F64BACE
MWRATKDAIPSRVNLVKRKVLTDPICQAYGAKPESTLLALWSCPSLKEVWVVHFGELMIETTGCSSFLEVFCICLEKSHPTDLFAMLAYLIWFRRNKLRMGEKMAELNLINLLARETLQEFNLANSSPSKPPPALTSTKWMPPPSGCFKANFDGAVFQERAVAGLGTIIRNDCGLVMAALTQVIPLPT